MLENEIILIVLSLLFLLSIFLSLRLIYWKNLRIEKISEVNTTVGIKDYKTMKGLIGVSGIWAQYVGKKCWNVCKTNDMGREMLLDSRRCITALSNTLKNDKRLREDYTYQGSIAIRYRDLIKYAATRNKKIRFVIVLTVDKPNDDLLEFEEMKYAIKHKAIAWNPAPGKQIKIYSDWKANGGRIEKYKKKYLE